MKEAPSPLQPGLYITATPIGNLKDITLRAIEVLSTVDIIACEDTRISGKLLNHFGISKKLINYHEHNGEKMRPLILDMIKEGKSVALISDAGTPLISDPGYKLVREAQDRGIYVTTIPGASSIVSALTLSGLATDHFLFCGFIQRKKISEYTSIPYTLVFLASPHKILDELQEMKVLFKNREVSLVREISKMFEEVKRGTFEEVIDYFQTHPLKGEIVLLVGPNQNEELMDEAALNEDIQKLKGTVPTKDLASILAGKYNIPKKDVYTRITKLLDR